MDKSHISKAELWAYISKTADQETIRKVELWKDSSEYDEELFSQLTAIYLNTKEYPVSVEDAKNRFLRASKNTKQKRVSRAVTLLKYAAMIAVIVAVGYTYQQFSESTSQLIVEETSFGENKQLNLPDGSVVWLNASTQLSYESNTPRTISLEGEAFFEVAKDTAHPFTVTTSDGLKIEALGTSFNVKSYSNTSIVETKLLTGKVAVTSAEYLKGRILLLPDEKVVFDRNSKQFSKQDMGEREGRIAWREGKIEFANQSFREIANDLYMQYQVKLVFENDEIANSKFTGVFDKNTPVSEILEILKTSKDFNYHLNTEADEWVIK
ncbi:FecR family protein [Algoriphagus sp. Y33]|uniref:FecR family protein n=1 Tax=Algoriphagus sp. Y33 TaxID=2772483 RepID=UPI00177E7551|nr:FecR domain-containing protein [Algoriphagus sp. Y33]